MIINVLKSKIMWALSIMLLTIFLLPAMAFGAVQLPEISVTYGYGQPGLVCPEGYDGPVDVYLYTGQEIRPKVHIYDFSDYTGNELIEGRDYDLLYKNNINAGKATVIAIGKGNYSGTVSYIFVIEKRDISHYDEYEYGYGVYIEDETYAYTGKPIKPKVIANKFKQGIDFDVSYSNNVNQGKGTVLITGKGLYGGTIKLTFRIKRLTALKVKAVYQGTKKIICTVSNAVIGDKVTLKIGNKSYTKKVNKRNSRYIFKVPKQKYGKKYAIAVRSKSGSLLKSKSTKVWYTNKLRTGQTKKQVRYNPNWGAPSYKNVYSGYSGRQETWAYEYYASYGNWYNTAYLYFRNGRLTGWSL